MAADPRNVVSKASWAKLLNEAWSSAVNTENIVSGFRACGIYPYNPAAIPQKAYQPSTSWMPQATSGNPDVTITTAEGRSKEASADTVPRKPSIGTTESECDASVIDIAATLP